MQDSDSTTWHEPSNRPYKRRRSHPTTSPDPMNHDAAPSDTLKLQQLPFEAAKLIINHLRFLNHPHQPPPSAQTPVFTADLAALSTLRPLCRLLRDAVDAHVVSLDLAHTPATRVAALLATSLPRYASLTHLALSGGALDAALAPHYARFFSGTRARLQHLTVAAARVDDAIARVLAVGCAGSLETLATPLMPVLRAVIVACPNVCAVKLLMDELDARMLPLFAALRSAKLLYRRGVSVGQAEALVAGLRACAGLANVELRMNNLPSSMFGFLAHVPRLQKLALFDSVVEEAHRGMGDIVRCAHVEELHLEWIEELLSADVAVLAAGLGRRLKHVRIWNCRRLTDEALVSIATHCPTAEVEVQFERDQFQPRTLALFGERISWGSCAMSAPWRRDDG